MNANGICRIRAKAGFGDVVATTQAFAIASIVDPRQGGFYPRAFEAAALSLGAGHCLVLQGIHAAEPSDAGLVEFHRRAVSVVLFFNRAQLGPSCFQALAHLGDEMVINHIVA